MGVGAFDRKGEDAAANEMDLQTSSAQHRLTIRLDVAVLARFGELRGSAKYANYGNIDRCWGGSGHKELVVVWGGSMKSTDPPQPDRIEVGLSVLVSVSYRGFAFIIFLMYTSHVEIT
jgi:hypothetical protein